MLYCKKWVGYTNEDVKHPVSQISRIPTSHMFTLSGEFAMTIYLPQEVLTCRMILKTEVHMLFMRMVR